MKQVEMIARVRPVSRNPLRKILRMGPTDLSSEREPLPMPRIGRWQGRLGPFLSSIAGKPSRRPAI